MAPPGMAPMRPGTVLPGHVPGRLPIPPNVAGAQAAHVEPDMMAELAEAENKVLSVMNTAITVIKAMKAKMSGKVGAPVAEDADIDKLTREYVSSVERIQDILQGMLMGSNERLSYRPYNRTSYGPLLDLSITADEVSHVHKQLADLKEMLESSKSKQEGKAEDEIDPHVNLD